MDRNKGERSSVMMGVQRILYSLIQGTRIVPSVVRENLVRGSGGSVFTYL